MNRIFARKNVGIGIVLITAAISAVNWLARNSNMHFTEKALALEESDASRASKELKVDVVKPHRGGIDRKVIVPGSIHAFESAELFAKVSGYVRKVHVDIGDRVTEGQLLAEIDSLELHRDVDRLKAAVDKSHAQVGQMKARLVAAQADKVAAETGIARALASIKRDEAALEFRQKQFARFQQLVQSKSVDERLLDEKEDQRLAASAAVDASRAVLGESKAIVASAEAKVEQARADIVDAQADVEVAKANLAKSLVFAEYTRITSPYDGVVTTRGFHRGDFIRGADQSGVQPLFTVERTDIVRLIVHVPDSDVPFTNPGDETVTVIDALPGQSFAGRVSRIAFSEDRRTKTMRTEVDLPNDEGMLRNGMYGRTTLMIQAGQANAVTIPSSAMSGSTKEGRGTVFVVKDGIARKKSVTVIQDNGILVEIIDGLNGDEDVIVGNNNAVMDGRRVKINESAVISPSDRK